MIAGERHTGVDCEAVLDFLVVHDGGFQEQRGLRGGTLISTGSLMHDGSIMEGCRGPERDLPLPYGPESASLFRVL